MVGQGTGCRRSPTHPVSSFNNWLALAVHYTSSHRTRTCATGSSPAGSSRELPANRVLPRRGSCGRWWRRRRQGSARRIGSTRKMGRGFVPSTHTMVNASWRAGAQLERSGRRDYDDGSEGDAGQVRRRACRRRRRLRRQRRRRQQPVRLLGGDRFGDTFDVQL